MASITATTRALKSRLRDSNDPLDGLLDEQLLHELCRAIGHSWRCCFWRPTVVILTFLRQVLLPQCSCRQTVAITIAAARAARPSEDGQGPSDDPSAYSQARQRLPLALLEKLAGRLASGLAQPDQLWHGHPVRVVDGSGVSMPDTPALQEVFPQPTSQAKGCGFPVARLVAMFCWASGALLSLVSGSLAIGELALFRRLFDQLKPNDLVLADRLFGNYTELALLQGRGVYVVCRVNAARRLDLRRGQRLAKGDHRLIWTRPKQVPMGLAMQDWNALPQTLTVRVVRIKTVCQRGFRSRRIDLVTTLFDSAVYPPEALAELYRQRWLVELNLRSLKITLGMDVLRCQSPEMVRKEIAMHQIAYNLIRMLMVRAARTHGVDLQRLSFAGTQQRLLAWLPHWTPTATIRAHCHWIHQFLAAIAADTLPTRPGRNEPRAIKRRRKSYPYLVHPRHQARKTAWYDKR
jgi:hypothetical protein